MLTSVIAVAAEPPQFLPVNAPDEMHPGTHFFFSMHAYTLDFSSLDYELISAPTNATFFIGQDRGAPVAVFDCWQFDGSAIGSNFTFSVRAISTDGSMLSATQTFNLRVAEVPPIASIQLSNQKAVLTLKNLVPQMSYNLEYVSNLSLTNWQVLSHLFVQATSTDVFDTNHIGTQRFYRLRPEPFICYTGESCP